MTTRHSITAASVSYAGKAFHPGYSIKGRLGVEVSHLFAKDYGAIPAAITGGIVAAATSTQAPNANTKTYTADTDGTDPLDNSTRPTVVAIKAGGVTPVNVWDLATARNVVTAVTHATSVVAMTVTYSGYDEYFEPMTELHTVTATGTTKTVTGKKAFRYLYSVAMTAAGDATANTITCSTGVVIGLPVRAANLNNVLITRVDGTIDAATVVAAVDTTATNATGDVRGTVTFASAPDGTKRYSALIHVVDRSTKALAFGVTQA